MTDRLAEIEANLSDGSYTWGRYSDEHHDADNDVQWLIEEVKRLRELCNRPETTSRMTYDRRG